MSTKKIIICAVIAYLVLTFSLALFDKNDSVVRFVAVGLALVMFILAWFDYEGNMHPLARYNMRVGKLFKKKFFSALAVGGIVALVVWVLFMPFIMLWRWLFDVVQANSNVILITLGILIAIAFLVFAVIYFRKKKVSR